MTTNHSARSGQQTGMLKTFLVVGSLVATLAGTRLLAAQDTAVVATTAPTDAAVTVVVPADNSATVTTSLTASTLPLPPTSGGTQVELKAIPQAVQPQIQPVASARSSR